MKKTIKQLDQMQLTFIDLAQQVHNIRTTVDYETSEVDEPPFDRYCYIWNLEWHHHPLLWLKLLLPYYLWLLSLHISSLCSVFTRYPLILGSRISTHYHHLKLILSPFTYSFYLFIHSFTFTYNLPTAITDPSRLAFSRRSLVPLRRRWISISKQGSVVVFVVLILVLTLLSSHTQDCSRIWPH